MEKQSFLFCGDSTWLPSDKGLLTYTKAFRRKVLSVVLKDDKDGALVKVLGGRFHSTGAGGTHVGPLCYVSNQSK